MKESLARSGSISMHRASKPTKTTTTTAGRSRWISPWCPATSFRLYHGLAHRAEHLTFRAALRETCPRAWSILARFRFREKSGKPSNKKKRVLELWRFDVDDQAIDIQIRPFLCFLFLSPGVLQAASIGKKSQPSSSDRTAAVVAAAASILITRASPNKEQEGERTDEGLSILLQSDGAQLCDATSPALFLPAPLVPRPVPRQRPRRGRLHRLLPREARAAQSSLGRHLPGRTGLPEAPAPRLGARAARRRGGGRGGGVY